MKLTLKKDDSGDGWWGTMVIGEDPNAFEESTFFDKEGDAKEWIDHHKEIEQLRDEKKKLVEILKKFVGGWEGRQAEDILKELGEQ